MQGRLGPRLQEGDGGDTGGDTEELGTEVGGTVVDGGRGGGGGDSAVGGGHDVAGSAHGGGGGLDLSVGDLGDNGALGGGGGLDLSVRDLGDDWAVGGSGGLDLSVGDLSDDRASASGGLDLSVRDLGDNTGAVGLLGLSVGELADGVHGSAGGLDLSVADLGDGRGGGLAVSGLTTGASAERDNLDGDGRALGGDVLIVEVVEGTAQALVEDSRVAKGEGVVSTDRPASGVDGTSLGGLVELELVVGSDVGGGSVCVEHDTVGKGEDEGLIGTL